MGTKIKLDNVRLSFPELWKAKEFKTGDGKPRYSISLLIAPGSPQDLAVKAAIEKAISEEFDKPEKAAAFKASVAGQKNQYCYLPGDAKDYAGYAGMMVLSAHRKEKDGIATIVDADRTILQEKSGRPYGGCYVNAILEIYVQTGENPGVRCGFTGVQFFRDGEPFSGGAAAKVEEFDNCAEGSQAADMAQAGSAADMV